MEHLFRILTLKGGKKNLFYGRTCTFVRVSLRCKCFTSSSQIFFCVLRVCSLHTKVTYWWEPAREFPPMTRSCGRALMGKASQGSRAPPSRPHRICLSIYPKTRICLFYYIMTFTNSSDINRGYLRPPFSEENQLKTLVNKSPGHNRSVSIQTPLMTF